MPYGASLIVIGVGELGVENDFPAFIFNTLRARTAGAPLAVRQIGSYSPYRFGELRRPAFSPAEADK